MVLAKKWCFNQFSAIFGLGGDLNHLVPRKALLYLVGKYIPIKLKTKLPFQSPLESSGLLPLASVTVILNSTFHSKPQLLRVASASSIGFDMDIPYVSE